MNYYNQIKDLFIKNEVYKQVKDYSKNRSDLNTYYEVGKLLIEAQGGEGRAKYGNKIIKEYSDKLTKELGKGYTVSSLKRMRKFYLINQKGQALPAQLIWSHICEILPLKNKEEINYYVDVVIKQNLSYRDLRERIKSKEYERIGYKEELPEHIGQIIKYMQYVDKNIKEPFNDKTVGIIICKREDKFVVSYSSDYSIFSTKYILNEI